jgi:hypothetical protein
LNELPWVALSALLLWGCSSGDGDGSAEGGSTTPSGGASGAGTSETGGASAGGGSGNDDPTSVVWIDTPVIEHDKDYHPFAEYLNPDVPANWESPVNYADGDVTIRIELLETASAGAFPVYYLIGWESQDGEGYVRGGAKFDALGTFEERVRVKDFQRVVNGVDAGSVEDDWDWSRAFQSPNGDTWGAGGAPYPLRVKVRLTLHPAP